MRRLATLAAIALAGCQGRPDAAACERFGALAYGAGTRTKMATVTEDATTPDGIAGAIGLDTAPPLNRAQLGVWRDEAARGERLTLRLVKPDWAGVGPVCAFVLRDGALEPGSVLLDRAERAARRVRIQEEALAIAGETGGRLRQSVAERLGRRGYFDCCAGG